MQPVLLCECMSVCRWAWMYFTMCTLTVLWSCAEKLVCKINFGNSGVPTTCVENAIHHYVGGGLSIHCNQNFDVPPHLTPSKFVFILFSKEQQQSWCYHKHCIENWKSFECTLHTTHPDDLYVDEIFLTKIHRNREKCVQI